MSPFELQRQSVLNGIVGYRLLHDYINGRKDSTWMELEKFINDLPGGDFELMVGIANLATVLMVQMSVISGQSFEEILAAIGQHTALIEE